MADGLHHSRVGLDADELRLQLDMSSPRLIEKPCHGTHDVRHDGYFYLGEVAVDIAELTPAAKQSVYHRERDGVGYLNDDGGLAHLFVLYAHIHHAHEHVIRQRVVELAVPLLLDIHE